MANHSGKGGGSARVSSNCCSLRISLAVADGLGGSPLPKVKTVVHTQAVIYVEEIYVYYIESCPGGEKGQASSLAEWPGATYKMTVADIAQESTKIHTKPSDLSWTSI